MNISSQYGLSELIKIKKYQVIIEPDTDGLYVSVSRDAPSGVLFRSGIYRSIAEGMYACMNDIEKYESKKSGRWN